MVISKYYFCLLFYIIPVANAEICSCFSRCEKQTTIEGTLSSPTSFPLKNISKSYNELNLGPICSFSTKLENSLIKFEMVYIRATIKTNVETIETTVKNKFSDVKILQNLFGKSVKLTDISVTLDVNECESSISNCSQGSTCYHKQKVYNCSCDSMSKSRLECKKITCLISEAPQQLKDGLRYFVSPEGKRLNEDFDTVDYGTEAIFTCKKYYEFNDKTALKDFSTKTSYCGMRGHKQTNWSKLDAKCVISFGFKIAIAISVVSGLIILIISSLMISRCSKKSPEKEESSQFDSELNQVYRSWNS